jgi:hypothetical protein
MTVAKQAIDPRAAIVLADSMARPWPQVALLLLGGVLAGAQVGKAIITLPLICAEMKIGVDMRPVCYWPPLRSLARAAASAEALPCPGSAPVGRPCSV